MKKNSINIVGDEVLDQILVQNMILPARFLTKFLF